MLDTLTQIAFLTALACLILHAILKGYKKTRDDYKRSVMDRDKPKHTGLQ